MAKFQLALKSKYEDRFWSKRGAESRWVSARDLEDGWKLVLFNDEASAESTVSQLMQGDQWCISMNESHDVRLFMPYSKDKVSVEIRKVPNGSTSNETAKEVS